MSFREGLHNYYSRFGVRGVLAISSFRLFGFPGEISGQAPGIRHPVHLRMRTTDPCIYSEILLRAQYGFDMDYGFAPKVILDAGANIGMASIYFIHRYPEAKIIAVEAEPSNFAILARNVRPYPSIVPVHAALWNRDGEIAVSEPDPATGANGEWAFVTREGGDGKRVRAVAMSTLMRELNVEAVDLAKIDIEGAEIELFEDAAWLAGTCCVMVELHDQFREGCTAAVEPALRGFTRTRRGETTFFVREASMLRSSPHF